MTMYGRSPWWAAALALGLAGLIGVSAATVHAAPARSAASAFELSLEGEITETADGPLISRGTFRSRAPFCATGTFVDEGPIRSGSTKRRFTCDDGTGSLTVSIARREYYAPGELSTTWHIVDGTSSYAGLGGGGSLRAELLNEEGFAKWRSALEGIVGRDSAAPRVGISRAKARKLHRPAGAYSIKLALALRDNFQVNPISYRVRVSAGGAELARKFGTARGALPMSLRIRPPAGARTVRVALTAEDPIGNMATRRRAVKLARSDR